MTRSQTIKIIIERGLLAAVENLPPGWSYEVEDLDTRNDDSPRSDDAKSQRLHAVHYDFREGDYERRETAYVRATPQLLERYIRHELRELSVCKAKIIWRLENQWASANDPYAYDLTHAVKVSAEEISQIPPPEVIEL
jgi:hypothetical protein